MQHAEFIEVYCSWKLRKIKSDEENRYTVIILSFSIASVNPIRFFVYDSLDWQNTNNQIVLVNVTNKSAVQLINH